ncbi:MAG: baseplate J/gp47 family protein [Lachnospiraceae bacterium]|nr:baseplate J/gp47 family protein [Lachnospiraceae bacterium]
MLNVRKKEEGADAKEFGQMMQAAMSQILLYDSEWTNHNVSDPGITILENLTAFQALQRSGFDTVSDAVLEKLCAMAGFTRQKGQAATVYLSGEKKAGSDKLLPNQKLYAGDLCFETEQEQDTEGKEILGIFRETDGERCELTEQLRETTPGSIELFGRLPKQGDCLYLIMRSIPSAGEWLRILVRTKNKFPRNRMSGEAGKLFADLEWSLYTRNGYQQIEYLDESGAFLQDGMIAFRMPEAESCPDLRLAEEGCVLRCRLTRAEYDVSPRVISVTESLFPVRQKDTLAATLFLEQGEQATVRNAMLENHYLSVYGLEQDGFYYEYSETNQEETGKERSFCWKKEADGIYRFSLSGSRFAGKGSEDRPCAVLVLRSSQMMLHYKIGIVYGYKDQILSLSPFRHILSESFFIAACLRKSDGHEKYQFFRPGEKGGGALEYTLLEEEGAIRIEDAGDYEEAELFVCGCAVHMGEKGNIRSGNTFHCTSKEETAVFYNPVSGFGGRWQEDIRETGRRFAEDIRKPAGLVNRTDYEEMIRSIPGLGIQKVRAFACAGKNEVCIAVKPYGTEPFPKLPAVYRRVIEKEIAKRRMLSVKVRLLEPVYVPVDVSGTIHVKPFYENCKEQVEEVLCKMLDCVSSDRDFGTTISFHEICSRLEALDCVEEIYHLVIQPQVWNSVSMQGADIQMHGSCLCCPGRLELEYSRKR